MQESEERAVKTGPGIAWIAVLAGIVWLGLAAGCASRPAGAPGRARAEVKNEFPKLSQADVETVVGLAEARGLKDADRVYEDIYMRPADWSRIGVQGHNRLEGRFCRFDTVYVYYSGSGKLREPPEVLRKSGEFFVCKEPMVTTVLAAFVEEGKTSWVAVNEGTSLDLVDQVISALAQRKVTWPENGRQWEGLLKPADVEGLFIDKDGKHLTMSLIGGELFAEAVFDGGVLKITSIDLFIV